MKPQKNSEKSIRMKLEANKKWNKLKWQQLQKKYKKITKTEKEKKSKNSNY